MPHALTMNSTITCGHPSPGGGGKVTPQSKQSVLTIDGVEVLVDTLQGASILPGCSQLNSNAGEVICSTVSSQSDKTSTVLQVDGKPVLLHQSSGKTNGKPSDTWSETAANQLVLTAD